MSTPKCAKVEHAGYRGSDGAVCCCLCDNEAEWRDCDACCGDGFLDGYEDDPINYSPGEDVTCHMCGGNGGDHVCTTQGCPTVTMLSIFAEKPQS
jgi:hypothetical protein